MTLEKFAKSAGVRIGECSGGKYGYVELDNPQTVVYSFRTKNAAYKHWFTSTFGARIGRAIMRLINQSSKEKA